MVFLKFFFEKADFEKKNRWQKSMKNYPGGKELIKRIANKMSYQQGLLLGPTVLPGFDELQQKMKD